MSDLGFYSPSPDPFDVPAYASPTSLDADFENIPELIGDTTAIDSSAEIGLPSTFKHAEFRPTPISINKVTEVGIETSTETSWLCDACGESFKDDESLDRHARLTSHKAFRCPDEGCDKAFSSLASFNDHEQRHKDRPTARCVFCSQERRQFLSTDLDRHLFIRHDVRRGMCTPGWGSRHCRHQDCPAYRDYHFLSERAYMLHLRDAHNEAPFLCDYRNCSLVGKKGFLTVHGLSSHQKTHIGLLTRFLWRIVQSLSPLTFWIYQLSTLSSVAVALKNTPPTSGKRRIFWTCPTCKQALYDDFLGVEEGALEELERRLNVNPCDTAESPAGEHQTGHSNAPWIPRTHSARESHGLEATFRSTVPKSLPEEDGLPLSVVDGSFSMDRDINPIKPAFLLCCINSSQYGTTLHHLDLRGVDCDRSLFQLLHNAYALRRSRWRLSDPFRNVQSLKLVRFRRDISNFVDIQSHELSCINTVCTCLPPPEKVEPAPKGEYRCKPIPPQEIPPIGENRLMHYFFNPSCINPWQTSAYSQFPKRTSGPLGGNPDLVVEGWGLHFDEGLDWSAIWAVLLFFFILPSMALLPLWAVYKRDLQGASGIATYWIGVGTVLLGYFATRKS